MALDKRTWSAKFRVIFLEFLAGIDIVVVVIRRAVIIEPGLHSLSKILGMIHM